MMEPAQDVIPAYGDWAALYRRFRPAYAPAAYALLGSLAPGRRLCIELGAGSGQATGDLLKRYERVVAIEPDPHMAALLPPHPHLEVLVERAEDAVVTPGCADAVVAASSLHWMDQAEVARRAGEWLRPGGVFFAYGYAATQYPRASASVMDVLSRYARHWRAFVPPRLSSWRPYADALRRTASFATVEEFELFPESDWSAEALAGFLLSTSYGRAYACATGDPEAARSDLEAALTGAAKDGAIRVRLPIEGAYAITAAAPAI